MGNLLQTFILDTEVSGTNEDISDDRWESLITKQINKKTALAAYAAVVVTTTLMLMYLEKRKGCCLNCLNGRFALLVPVNFLEGRKRRKAVVSVFALATIEIISMLATTKYTEGQPNYIQVSIKLVLTALMSLIFLPILSCIHMGSVSSCLIGFVYTSLYIINIIVQSIPAPTVSMKNLVGELALRVLVIPFAGSYIIYWFAKRIFVLIFFGLDDVDRMSARQMKYIKNVLRCKKDYEALISQNKIETEQDTSKFVAWFRTNIYHNVHGFRYSLTILISCTVGFLIVTKLAVEFMYICTENFIQFNIELQQKETETDQYVPNFIKMALLALVQSKRNKGISDEIDQISELSLWKSGNLILYIGALLAAIIAYLMNSITVCHMLMAYRKNVLDIYRKKHDDYSIDYTTISNTDIALYAIQFTGYQVAYLMWGFLIQFFFLSFTLVIGGELLILPIIHALGPFLLWLLDWIGPIVAVLILSRGIQFLLIKYVFLMDYGKIMALDNRKGFFIMMYIVFFYNIFTGVFSCLKRILIGMVIGIYLVPRLDRCVLPQAFECRDEGYTSYRCLLYLEAMQSNPIVKCFVGILAKSHYTELNNAIWRSYDYEECDSNPDYFSRKKRARNRWLLAYTLLCNPSLAQLRKHAIFSSKSILMTAENKIIELNSSTQNSLVHTLIDIGIGNDQFRNLQSYSHC